MHGDNPFYRAFLVAGLLLVVGVAAWVSAFGAATVSAESTMTKRVGINGSGCEFTSISLAIQAAENADIVIIDPGIYSETLPAITTDITLVPGQPGNNCKLEDMAAESNAVIIDGGGGSADPVGGLVEVNAGATVTFRHLWLRNATATNGGILAVTGNSKVTLDDVLVSDGTATTGGNIVVDNATLSLINDTSIYRGTATLGDGGGIAVVKGDLQIDDANIGLTTTAFNEAGNNGGGIYAAARARISLNLAESKILHNRSDNFGGGIYIDDSTLDVFDGLFEANSAKYSGGGIYVTDADSDVSIENAHFHDNETRILNTNQGGGAIYTNFVDLAIEAATFTENSAANLGGAVALVGSNQLDITSGTVISGNTARGGGGVALLSGSLYLSDTQVINNQATGISGGGGIYCSACPSATLLDVEIAGNSAEIGGGTIIRGSTFSPVMVQMDRLTVQDNSASDTDLDRGIGGGLLLRSVDGTLNNSTIENNDADNGGGGMWIDAQSTLDSTNLSIILNDSHNGDGGGLHVASASDLTLRDSDISGNSAETGGGAAFIESTGTFVNVKVRSNITTINGGGLALTNAGFVMTADLSTCSPASLPANSYCSELRANNSAVRGGGIYVTADIPSAQTKTEISNTAFWQNISAIDGAALYKTGTLVMNTWLTNTIVSGNGSFGQGIPAITLRDNGNLSIHSSTLANNFGSPLLADPNGGAASLDISNSIVYFNADGTRILFGTALNASCNTSQSEASGSISLPGSSSSNPLFDPSHPRGAFHLSASSPAIDACSDGPEKDLDFGLRPVGGQYDQGAFERGAVPTAVGMRQQTTGDRYQVIGVMLMMVGLLGATAIFGRNAPHSKDVRVSYR